MPFTLFERFNLDKPSIKELIKKEVITEQEAAELDPFERFNLESSVIQIFIKDGLIDKDSAKKLLPTERLSLETPFVQDLLKRKIITFEIALKLTLLHRINLESRVKTLIRRFEDNIKLKTNNYLEVNTRYLLSPAENNMEKADVIFKSMKKELYDIIWLGFKDLDIYDDKDDPRLKTYIHTAKNLIIHELTKRQEEIMNHNVKTSRLNKNGGYVEQNYKASSTHSKNKTNQWFNTWRSSKKELRTPLLDDKVDNPLHYR